MFIKKETNRPESIYAIAAIFAILQICDSKQRLEIFEISETGFLLRARVFVQ